MQGKQEKIQNTWRGDWMTQIGVLLIAHSQNRRSLGSSEVSNFKRKCDLFQHFSEKTPTQNLHRENYSLLRSQKIPIKKGGGSY